MTRTTGAPCGTGEGYAGGADGGGPREPRTALPKMLFYAREAPGKKQLSPYSLEPIFPIYSPSKLPDKTDVDFPQLSAHLELCTFQCASFPSHRGP